MKPQLYVAKLSIKPSLIHGYGVFAEQDFNPSDLIEECYAPYFERDENALINYYFAADQGSALCFGFGSIYNHSDQPNADHEYDSNHSVMNFRALRPIKRGEEIFISYGKSWFDSRNTKAKKLSFYHFMRKKLSSLRFIFRFLIVFMATLILMLTMKLGLLFLS